ncbi:MAG TPA: DUF4145 domain-containing protein, partial [Ignavibacteria bacterium]|nr:DUF4145 domain-containing protein [Ignavibacteria bacterium]
MDINYKSNKFTSEFSPVSFTCPHCGHKGIFHQIVNVLHNVNGDCRFGTVVCPSQECKSISFIIIGAKNRVLQVYPSVLIDFDKSNIPTRIIEVFEEALKAHSVGCFVASAIMIRKTLEVIAEDKKSTGKNLKERIEDLGSKIMIPKELISAMDELRLFGNDAAHVEAKVFENIDKEEVEI